MADKKEKKAPADKKQRELAHNGGKKLDDREALYNAYADEQADDLWHEIEPGSEEDPLVIEGHRKLDDSRGGGRGQVGQGNQPGARGTNN